VKPCTVAQQAARGFEKIPLLRPLLPSLESLEPYLREIDENRWYTNFGPLVKRFEDRLAEHFDVPRSRLVTFASGTTALSAALIAIGPKPGTRCLVPAWTFVASAAAVCAANLVPHFIDILPGTWMPDPYELRRRADLADVGAVMLVGPFGLPVDTAAWDAFSDDTGIPVVIDAAACFDAVASTDMARPGRSPAMISLHATKVFGVGEGGLIVSTDEAIVHRVRQVGNFGIWHSPEAQVIGSNGKLSEYHAAVGLAALDRWPDRRKAVASRTGRYLAELARIPQVTPVPGYGEGWVSAYCTVRLPSSAAPIQRHMAELGIESRRWWHNGVQSQPAYQRFPHDDLPVTQELAGQTLSLPFSPDMSDAQIVRVVDCLELSLRAPARAP
jgi:dTDP-4-amino-4,6-dideoxygalactose transaminase